MSFTTIDILDIPFTCTTQLDFIKQLELDLNKPQPTFIVTANPEIVMFAKKTPSFSNLLKKADYITADGIGIIKASKKLNTPLPERVTGYDILCDLLVLANKKNFSVYFLGAKEDTLDLAVKNVGENYPNLKIAGSHHGYFDINDEKIITNIKNTNPDFIFVALGFPRQEEWIAQAKDEIGKGIFIGVGGSFDVLAGTVKRAPVFWQKLHLEWFYRLLKQPSRFKRMLAIPKFMLAINKENRK